VDKEHRVKEMQGATVYTLLVEAAAEVLGLLVKTAVLLLVVMAAQVLHQPSLALL